MFSVCPLCCCVVVVLLQASWCCYRFRSLAKIFPQSSSSSGSLVVTSQTNLADQGVPFTHSEFLGPIKTEESWEIWQKRAVFKKQLEEDPALFEPFFSGAGEPTSESDIKQACDNTSGRVDFNFNGPPPALTLTVDEEDKVISKKKRRQTDEEAVAKEVEARRKKWRMWANEHRIRLLGTDRMYICFLSVYF